MLTLIPNDWNLIESPQNVGSRDPGSQRRFCQVKKVSPKIFAHCCEFLDYQKKNSSIAIMYHTYKNFLSLFISKPSCIMLTGIFICFLLPNLKIFRDISRSHLIDFVVWITQKWGRLGLVKFGPEEGQHVLWTLSNWKRVEVWETGIKRLNFKNVWNEQSFIFAIQFKFKLIKS